MKKSNYFLAIILICIISCTGNSNKIKPGTEGKTYTTTFGSVNVSINEVAELHVSLQIKNPEAFCLSKGGLIQDFTTLISGDKEYLYDNLEPSLLILNTVYGENYLLSDIPEILEITYTVNQEDKAFSFTVCSENISFEVK